MTDDAGHVGWGEAPALKDWAASTAAISARAPRPSCWYERYLGPGAVRSRSAISACCISAWTPRSRAIPTPRRRSISPPTTSPAGAPASRCTTSWAGLRDAHPGRPLDRADGGRGRRARGRQGRRRGHPYDQDQGRGRAGARRRDGRRFAPPSVPDVALCVDANEGYRTPGEAIKTIRRMEAFDLVYAEERVHGIARMAEVARAIDTQAMADESAWSSHDIESRAARGADRLDLHRQAGRALSRHGGRRGCARRRYRLQRQRLGRARHRQPRQPGAGGVRAGRTLVLVVPVSTPASAQRGADRRYLLQGRPDRRADGFSRRRRRMPSGPGLGMEVDRRRSSNIASRIERCATRSSRASAGSWPATGWMRWSRSRPELRLDAASSSLRSRSCAGGTRWRWSRPTAPRGRRRRHGGNHRSQSPSGRGVRTGRIQRQRDGLPRGALVRPRAVEPRRGCASRMDLLPRPATLRRCSGRCRRPAWRAAEQL